MGDRYNPLGVSGMINPYKDQYSSSYSGSSRNQMSDYEQELNPVFDQQMQGELQGRRQIQPLRKILDLLQRGQYVSANIVNGILSGDTAKEILTAAWQGATGEVKGSYSDVIREHFKEWGEKKLFKNAPEGSLRGQVDNAKVFGFLGDIFLDPTTYIGFGASKGATAAAKAYADDVVRVLSKEIGEKIGKEGAEVGLKQFGKGPMTQILDRAYREAYRKSLRMGGQELSEGLAKKIGDLPGLEDLTAKLADPSVYGKAGESAWNLGILGRSEVAAGTHPAFNRGMSAMSRIIKENPASATLADAWWSVMNRGPIAKIRELVNIRSPYATSVRHKELQEANQFLKNREAEMAMDVRRTVIELSEEERTQVFDLMSRAEQAKKVASEVTADPSQLAIGMEVSPTSVRAMLTDPTVMESLGIKDPEKIRKAIDDIQTLTEGWNVKTKEITEALGMNYSDLTDYLPTALKTSGTSFRGSGGTGFMKHRKMTKIEHTADDLTRVEWLYGATTEEARDILSKTPGLGSISTNLEESLLARGIAQTKLEQRFNIVEQFGEMGVPIAEMGQKAQQALRHGIDDPKLGLKTIQGVPGLEGKLFDYEVATVAEHAMNLTGPKNINSVQQLFQKFTSFWKGIVTMTPGFHLRNFYSNQIMQIMKHGAAAMDPKNMTDALSGVLYALDKTNLKKAASDFSMDHRILAKRLKTSRGNLTLDTLSDEAMRRGVISTDLMGSNAESILEQSMAKVSASPLSKDFAGRKASRWAGQRIENIARFQSFVMDYEAAAARGIDDALGIAEKIRLDEDALNYAALEAKKWFMDYGDLSDFEQSTLKQIIPFYSWLRKNIANQVQAVVLYPEIFSTVPKLEEFFTYESPDYDPDYLPDWMKQMGMFPTGQLEDGSFRMFNPNFPYQDLNKIPLTWEEDSWIPKLTFAEAKDDIVAGMHPMIRSAMSLATENGYDFFYKQELGETGDAPYLMRLFASNPGIIGLVDGLQSARGLNSTMQVDENGKLQIDGQVASLLEQNMPLLRWFEFLFYLPQAVIPGLEDMIERGTNAQDDYEGMAETLQLMSYYLGVKFSPADLEKEKLRVGRDIYYQSRDILNDQNRDTAGAQTRRMQYNNTTDASIRRLRG